MTNHHHPSGLGFVNAASQIKRNYFPEAALAAVIEASVAEYPSSSDVAYLAMKLAESGEILSLPTGRRSDIASSGGIGSMTTLLGPLIIAAADKQVVKISVPGRPAGALDILAQLKHYRYSIPFSEAELLLNRGNFLSVDASNWSCPADGHLFTLRRKTGFISVHALIVASLLSKKIAAGVTDCGFEIRYGPGANLSDSDSAGHLIQLFQSTSRIVGIRSSFKLVESSAIQQPFIGRGEVLSGLLKIIDSNSSPWLDEHCEYVCQFASEVIGDKASLDRTGIRKSLQDHLELQSSDLDELYAYVDSLSDFESETILADKDGHFGCDTEKLRKSLIEIQNRYISPENPFPDPCGIELFSRPGKLVRTGTPLYKIRYINPEEAGILKQSFAILN